jgi:hypothetical protein
VTMLHIYPDGEGCWPELEVNTPNVRPSKRLSLAALPGGMASGAPSVTVRVDLLDGTTVLAETSLALLLTAAEAFKARHGDPRR